MDEGTKLAAKVWRVTHGAVPVSNDSLGDKSSEIVIIIPAYTLDSNSNVGSVHGIITNTDLGPNEVGLLLLSGDAGCTRETGEVLLGEVDKLLVRNTPRANEDHTVGGVVCLNVVNQIIAGDALDVFAGSEDGATKGLALESSGVKMVEYNLFKLLVNFLLLS